MGSAFALWLLLAAEPLPMDWCLGSSDAPQLMEFEACEFFEEQTQMARLDAAYAALREATDPATVDAARTAFLTERELGCAVWADFDRAGPFRLDVNVCRMRRLLQRIAEIEEQLRRLP